MCVPLVHITHKKHGGVGPPLDLHIPRLSLASLTPPLHTGIVHISLA